MTEIFTRFTGSAHGPCVFYFSRLSSFDPLLCPNVVWSHCQKTQLTVNYLDKNLFFKLKTQNKNENLIYCINIMMNIYNVYIAFSNACMSHDSFSHFIRCL